MVTPPAGGPTPDAAPGPGSLYNVAVSCVIAGGIHPVHLSGLSVTCVETGVTLTIGCSAATFYMNNPGTYTFKTPGGSAISCADGTGGTYGVGSATATVPGSSSATIQVTYIGP